MLDRLIAAFSNNTVVAIITVISGLGVILGWATGWFRLAWRWIQERNETRRNSKLKKTLAFVRKVTFGNHFWSHGSVAHEEALQVIGDFLLTNISDPPRVIVLSDVKVRLCGRHRARIAKVFPILKIGKASQALPAGATADLSVMFFVIPRIVKSGEPLHADIAAVDQFGTEHWLRSVEFESRV